MTDLEHRALTAIPLGKDVVESFYAGLRSEEFILRALCESHERLRMELEGAEKLLAECGKKWSDAT